MSLTREQILAAQDHAIEAVEVPEWSGKTYVRMMTGCERDAYERSMYDKAKLGNLGENVRAQLLSLTVCDEAGTLLFTAADVEALGKKAAAPIERLVRVARKLNRLEDDPETAAKN